MPLPPAPTRKAALLTNEAYKTHAPASLDAADEETVALAPPAPAPAPVKTAAAAPAKPARSRRSSAKAEAPLAVAPVAPSLAATALTDKPVPSRAKPVKAVAASSKRSGKPRLFVLDTNVLLHDPMSLFRFEEHDIFLPMIVLEELDGHKKGMTEVARNGRQSSRTLDALVAQDGGDMAKGIALAGTGQTGAGGRLFLQTVPLND